VLKLMNFILCVLMSMLSCQSGSKTSAVSHIILFSRLSPSIVVVMMMIRFGIIDWHQKEIQKLWTHKQGKC